MRIRTICGIVLSVVLAGGVWAQNCSIEPLNTVAFDGYGWVMAAFDEDGAGPAPARLFLGGDLKRAGTAVNRHIARWDGSAWSAVAGDPLTESPSSMVVCDSGSGEALYIIAGRKLWRYTGQNWSVVPAPSSVSQWTEPLSITRMDSDGPGPEREALRVIWGEQRCNEWYCWYATQLFRFDGVSWEAQTAWEDPGWYGKLFVYDSDGEGGPLAPELYMISYSRSWVLRLVNQMWVPISDEGTAICAAVHDSDGAGPGTPLLYVGGQFGAVGVYPATVPAANIAAWDGSVWRSVGGGIPSNGYVRSLATYDPDGGGPRPEVLVAAGVFKKADGAPADWFTMWDGTSWLDLGQWFEPVIRHQPQNYAPDLQVMLSHDEDGPGPRQPALFLSGAFSTINGRASPNLAIWRDGVWDHVCDGPDGSVNTLAIFNDGSGQRLFAAGEFAHSGATTVNNVARWTGSKWQALGTGVEPTTLIPKPKVLTSVVHNDGTGWALYVGGSFSAAGGVTAYNIAKWNGQEWKRVGQLGLSGGGMGGFVHALTVHDPDGAGPLPARLYAAGDFAFADFTPVHRMAVWDGVAWADVAGGVTTTSPVRALRSWDDGTGPALYVGGDTMSAGGLPENEAFKLTAAGWASLPPIVSVGARVNAFALHDFGAGYRLCAVGDFPVSAPVYHRGVLRLGGVWQYLAPQYETTGYAARSADVGDGLSLFMESSRFKNGQWGEMAPYFTEPVRSISARFDDGNGESIFFGGDFVRLAHYYYQQSTTVARIARLRVCECYANCDGSAGPAMLNILDYVCFQQKFAAGDPAANCDGSVSPPVLNVADFVCFMNKYAAGCP